MRKKFLAMLLTVMIAAATLPAEVRADSTGESAAAVQTEVQESSAAAQTEVQESAAAAQTEVQAGAESLTKEIDASNTEDSGTGDEISDATEDGFDIDLSGASDARAMYRLYNPNSGEHFYTASAAERNKLVSVGWKFEMIGWVAPATGDPVYRLYNPNAGDHHYTASTKERDNLVRVGWRLEGIGWYSGGSVSVYRQYNPNAVAGAHNYTTSKAENDALIKAGWKGEGIAFRCMEEGYPADRDINVSNYSRDEIIAKIIAHYTALWQPDGTYNFSEGTVNTKNGFYGNLRLVRNTHGAVNPGFSANVIVTRIYVNTSTGYVYDADGYAQGWYIT